MHTLENAAISDKIDKNLFARTDYKPVFNSVKVSLTNISLISMCYITTENTYTCNIKVLIARANRIDREYISSVLNYVKTRNRNATER